MGAEKLCCLIKHGDKLRGLGISLLRQAILIEFWWLCGIQLSGHVPSLLIGCSREHCLSWRSVWPALHT